ncbi:MAG: hypothetical protein HQK57_05110 [Deltaproteobacteria bacterium]|nr:hypothetical protein [Deltaproteobacteria bacterium]
MNFLIPRSIASLFSRVWPIVWPNFMPVILTFAYLVALAYPAFQSDSYLQAQLSLSDEYKRISIQLLREVQNADGFSITKSCVIPLNLVVQVEITKQFHYIPDSGKSEFRERDTKFTPHLRYDNIALVLGTSLILSLVLSYVIRERSTRTHQSEAETNLTSHNQTYRPTDKVTLALGNTEEVLAASVLGAEKRAQILFSRSTLLLAGGIIMAFIGVMVFYFTLPYSDDRGFDYYSRSLLRGEPSTKQDSNILFTYLFHAIRPVGVLVFLEGNASIFL